MKKPLSHIVAIEVIHRTRQYVYNDTVTDIIKDSVLEVLDATGSILRFDFIVQDSIPLAYPENALKAVLCCYSQRLIDLASLPDQMKANMIQQYNKRIGFISNLLKVNLAVVDYSEGYLEYVPESVQD